MFVTIIIVLCAIIIYRYTTRNHTYWARKNVKHDRPLPFFGNHLKTLLTICTLQEAAIKKMNKFKEEKLVGYYKGNTLELIINDVEIAKQILIGDFKSFQERGIGNPENDPILNSMIMYVDIDHWRVIRHQWNSGFTPKNMKIMASSLNKWTDELEKSIGDFASRGEVVKSHELFSEYTLRFLGNCAMGVDLKKSDWIIFRDTMKRFYIFQNKLHIFAYEFFNIFPEIKYFFKKSHLLDKDLENKIMMFTKTLKEQRQLNPSKIKDFTDIFLKMATQRDFSNLSESDIEEAMLQYSAAQFLFFLLAGFETTSTAMSTTLHHLAYHLDIQVEIQKEIDVLLSKHGNKWVENLDQFTLLDMAIKESMRIFSPAGIMRRVCGEAYTIPGTEVTIDPGVHILIPIQGIHMNPDFFENPNEFRPNRFASEAENAHAKFLGFGDGPKKCIGHKLAMMMITAGVAGILRRYTVLPAPDSKLEITLTKTSFLAQILGTDLPLKFIPRQ